MAARLRVHDFRSLREIDLTFAEPVTLVVGSNGAGKSSLAGAIQYALQGKCQWTDGKGDGAAALVRHGRPRSTVQLTVKAGDILREITPKGASCSVDDKQGSDAAAILRVNLPHADLLTAMLRSEGFIGLPSKEMQDVLFRLSGGAADALWFREHLDKPEIAELEERLATRLTGAALADDLYKFAYALRTEVNRQVKDAGAKLKAMPDPGVVPDNIAELEASLREASQRAKDAVRGSGQGTPPAVYAAAQERAAAAGREVNDLAGKLAALGAKPNAPEHSLKVGLVTRLDEARVNLNEQSSAALDLQGQAKALDGQLLAFWELGDKCVLGGVECPLSAENRESVISETENKIAALKLGIEVADQARARLQGEVAELEGQIADHDDAASALARWTERNNSLTQQKASAETRQQAAQAELLGLSRPVEQVETDAEREVKQLEQTIVQARLVKQQAEQSATAEGVVAFVEARAKLLDGLVKKLSPDGLPAQAMSETVGKVVGAVNAALSQFTDFALSVVPGAEFSLDIMRGADVTPVALLSESERLRVGVGIQVAIAKLTGFGFVVVDAADRLDGDNRGKLLKMLLGSGIRSLVLATPANGKVPTGIAGLTAYRIENGELVKAA